MGISNIEYAEKPVYSFTCKGLEFRYFTYNSADSNPDYIYVPHTDKFHVGKVDIEAGIVTYRTECSELSAEIDADSLQNYEPEENENNKSETAI